MQRVYCIVWLTCSVSNLIALISSYLYSNLLIELIYARFLVRSVLFYWLVWKMQNIPREMLVWKKTIGIHLDHWPPSVSGAHNRRYIVHEWCDTFPSTRFLNLTCEMDRLFMCSRFVVLRMWAVIKQDRFDQRVSPHKCRIIHTKFECLMRFSQWIFVCQFLIPPWNRLLDFRATAQ